MRERTFRRQMTKIVQAKDPEGRCWECARDGRPQNRAIKGHSVQAKGSLREISDRTGHVMTFRGVRRGDEEWGPRRIGVREASTFRSLCAKHDNDLFRPLERERFVGSFEQLWAMFYRSVIWEYDRKRVGVQKCQELAQLYIRVGRAKGPERDAMRTLRAGMERGARDYRDHLRWLNKETDRTQAEELRGWAGTYSGPQVLAGTGAYNPQLTESGRPVQRIASPSATLKCLAYSVFVEADATKIVLAWRRQDTGITALVEELVEIVSKAEERGWPNWFFLHCENMYFNPEWWERLRRSKQEHIETLASIALTHAQAPERWRGRTIDEWRFTHGNWLG